MFNLLNFYQIAFSLTMSPSFPRSARAESKTESGIFTNILYPNSSVKNERISELKVNM